MHGRELGYDTRLNSTKAFAALFCLLEWAQPIARAQQELAKQQRLERYAGSDELDREGRRLDRREFDETKRALHRVATGQMGWYRNRGGRYRSDMLEERLREYRELLAYLHDH